MRTELAKEARLVKRVNWTETLRQMTPGMVLRDLTREDQYSITQRAVELKKKEGRLYSIQRDPETRLFYAVCIK